MITLVKGDIFEGNHQLLVNPVNCVGVMGKGLALLFKRKYPDIMIPYLHACNTNSISPGNPQLIKRNLAPEYIVNFPTKVHWKDPSKLEYIETGLKSFVKIMKELEVASIGMPALGCGLGELSWTAVQELILNELSQVSTPITLYSPL